MAAALKASKTLPVYSNSEQQKKPWKHIGYRGFTSFITSDNDFFILRRFSTLTARVLLSLQDELSELEEQLTVIDARLSDPLAEDIHNGSFREETSETRLELIREVDRKLRSYSKCKTDSILPHARLIILDELVLQHTQLRTRPKVSKKDAQSVANWFHNHPGAIHLEETQYINEHSDLFAVAPKDKAPLRILLEKSSRFRRWSLWRKTPKSQDKSIIYTSENKIEFFISLINTILGLAMLIAPLWILAFVEDRVFRLVVITVFLVCFLCLVTFTTVVRPFESLGATAA
jgi:hypothetical protein